MSELLGQIPNGVWQLYLHHKEKYPDFSAKDMWKVIRLHNDINKVIKDEIPEN
jgi:hypothetical protein